MDLSWLPEPEDARPAELPWQRGERLARHLRKTFGLDPSERLESETLESRLGMSLGTLQHRPELSVAGGLSPTSDRSTGFVKVAFRGSHGNAKRFAVARLIGCALVSERDSALLPVTDARTNLQRVERAFARELLCPWEGLTAYVEREGLDDDAIRGAAEHFEVSERLVLSTLVNKEMLPRNALAW
jgi:hypothetical protein